MADTWSGQSATPAVQLQAGYNLGRDRPRHGTNKNDLAESTGNEDGQREQGCHTGSAAHASDCRAGIIPGAIIKGDSITVVGCFSSGNRKLAISNAPRSCPEWNPLADSSLHDREQASSCSPPPHYPAKCPTPRGSVPARPIVKRISGIISLKPMA